MQKLKNDQVNIRNDLKKFKMWDDLKVDFKVFNDFKNLKRTFWR